MEKQKTQLEPQDKIILVYLENLIRRKGVKEMPEAIFSDMVTDLWVRFNKFLFLSVMQTLSSSDYEKFEDFLEKDSSMEEMLDFLKNNVENLEEVIDQGMANFERVYLHGVNDELKKESDQAKKSMRAEVKVDSNDQKKIEELKQILAEAEKEYIKEKSKKTSIFDEIRRVLGSKNIKEPESDNDSFAYQKYQKALVDIESFESQLRKKND